MMVSIEIVNTIRTIEEIAAYLRVPKSTVYLLAQEGKIPCQKVGRQWRFHKEAIDQWVKNTDINSCYYGKRSPDCNFKG